MKLQQIANMGVVVLNTDDPLNSAIQDMWRLNIRHLPVVENGTPVGIVSERDVLFHTCWLEHTDEAVGAQRTEPVSGATRIDHVMTKPVIVLSPEDPIEKAARLMLNKRISAVPLAVENRVVGIVTETDFLRCYNDKLCLVPSDACRQHEVVAHMSAHVFSVRSDDATLAAIRLMRDKQIRHVPVVDDGDLVGIVSDRDVLRGGPPEAGQQAVNVNELRVEHHLDVAGIMSKNVEVLAVTETLAAAAKEMVAHKIGALPVVEDGTLVGIITETDLLRAFVADCEQ